MTEDASSTAIADRALRVLHGQFAWSCRPGIGTFFTMEFGEPHLSVREPRLASGAASERVRTLLARRQVFVEGDNTLWVCNARWTVETREGLLTAATMQDATAELDGRRLLGHDFHGSAARVTLRFEDGVSLQIHGEADATGLSVWCLLCRAWQTVAVAADGSVDVEPTDT